MILVSYHIVYHIWDFFVKTFRQISFRNKAKFGKISKTKRNSQGNPCRIACPKFGQAALSSEFYDYAFNTEFVAAVGILQKNHACENRRF